MKWIATVFYGLEVTDITFHNGLEFPKHLPANELWEW